MHSTLFLSPSYTLILRVFFVAAVRKEISDETDRETGRSKQISSVPIHLSIYSPNGETEMLVILFCSLSKMLCKLRFNVIE